MVVIPQETQRRRVAAFFLTIADLSALALAGASVLESGTPV